MKPFYLAHVFVAIAAFYFFPHHPREGNPVPLVPNDDRAMAAAFGKARAGLDGIDLLRGALSIISK
ncbi:hypothetical protein LG047_02705 [Methylocystis sp. WRRC1]|uniref:hypothetical protein n=1 Tax=Methylocystis sp. WRRC1 TaxID=1732014 RepID=UPI001D15166C|nr:hypothetical protein [Methylocystis sp. WRRC1]MCC3244242.1 hypothetical protein [Methylocystis sp. WRRC1]